MSFKMFFIHIIFLLLSYFCFSAKTQNFSLTIPLNTTTTSNNREMFGEFININRSSTLQVNFEDIKENLTFIILQAHSHLYNLSMYNNSYVRDSYVMGTNVGMYSKVKPIDTFYLNNPNRDVDLKVYISVHGYGVQDPVPGGCNMVHNPSIYPSLLTTYDKDCVKVEFAPAKGNSTLQCEDLKTVEFDFFRMYLPERSFDSETYFKGIRNMMTLDKIWEHGEKIPRTSKPILRTFSAYPGTGSIYVAVAANSDGVSSTPHYAVYVPTVTYACSPLENGCQIIDDFLSQLLCAMMLFIGLFVCYFGHRFFKTEMFLIGLLSGIVVTYIVISITTELEGDALFGVSLLSGLFFGAIWLIFWWLYGIPVIAVFLSALNLGFLLAAIIFYSLPGGSAILAVDANYWALFIALTLFTSLVLVSVTLLSNILCCAILGAFAVVFPIDFYVGTSLKYIVINVVRRAVVYKFNLAVTSPPFDWKDITLTVLWGFLSVTGFLFQHYHNKGRPPFPPPPRNTRYGRVQGFGYGAVDNRNIRYGNDIASRLSTSQAVEPQTSEKTPLLS